MIKENKFSKYLLYAIGEIILVVIGILIALQVNKWNQARLDAIAEKQIIEKLHSEFAVNKNAIEKSLLKTQSLMDANMQLMKLVGASKEKLKSYNLDSLFHSGSGSNDVVFADNTFKNLLQTDRLSLLKNKELSELLYQWNALTEIRKSRVMKLDTWVNNFYLPYLLPKISFKEMDTYGKLKWSGKSKVKPDYYSLFQEVEFENYLDNILWYNQSLYNRSMEMYELIDKIIEVTRSDTQ